MPHYWYLPELGFQDRGLFLLLLAIDKSQCLLQFCLFPIELLQLLLDGKNLCQSHVRFLLLGLTQSQSVMRVGY